MKKWNLPKKYIGLIAGISVTLVLFLVVVFSGVFSRVEVVSIPEQDIVDGEEFIDIDGTDTPMGSIKTLEASFYLNTTGKDTKKVAYWECEKVGSGTLLISSVHSVLLSFFGDEDVESLVCDAPDTSAYTTDGRTVKWVKIVYSWFGYRIIGELVESDDTNTWSGYYPDNDPAPERNNDIFQPGNSGSFNNGSFSSDDSYVESPTPVIDNDIDHTDDNTINPEDADNAEYTDNSSERQPEEVIVPVEEVTEPDDNSSSNTEFATIAELKSANLSAGDYVHTLGHLYANDHGEGYYSIVESSSKNADDAFVIRLNNGLLAELQYSSDSILNAATLGIEVETRVSSRLNTVMKDYEGLFKGIQFNSGTYLIDRKTELRSFELYGSDTEMKVVQDFAAPANMIFKTPDNSGKTFDVTIKNIRFNYEVSNSHTLSNMTTVVLIQFQDINNCVLEDCEFIMQPTATDGAFQPGTVLWFKKQIAGSLTMRNCSVICKLGDAVSGKKTPLIGGSLWISGDNTSSPFRNIDISNCTFIGTQNDEVLAMWKGQFETASFRDTNFIAGDHLNNNIIALYGGTFTDYCFHNCDFIAQDACKRAFKLMDLTGRSDVLIRDCDVVVNGTPDMAEEDLASIYYFTGSCGDVYSGKTCARIEGGSITVDDAYNYRSIIMISKASMINVELEGVEISARSQNGLLWTDYSDNVSFVSNRNTFEMQDILMNNFGLADSSISFEGNNITGCITSKFHKYASVDFDFVNNTCDVTKQSTLFIANDLDISYGMSDVTFSGNTYSDDSLIREFYTDCYARDELMTWYNDAD